MRLYAAIRPYLYIRLNFRKGTDEAAIPYLTSVQVTWFDDFYISAKGHVFYSARRKIWLM